MSPKPLRKIISSRVPGFQARLGIVLGSGLGPLADKIVDPMIIPYTSIEHMPTPSVEGHAGQLILGTLSNVPVALLKGRVHLYEGQGAQVSMSLMQTFQELGCECVLLSNAAGSLREDFPPASLVAISDHINGLGTNPLIGQRPQFVDLTDLYDLKLRAHIQSHDAYEGLVAGEGVYFATLGPCFETPAEIRMIRGFGADLVGMSTVTEAIACRALGLRVGAISCVTNYAAGMTGQGLSHAQTLDVATQGSDSFIRLIQRLAENVNDWL